MIHNWSGKPQNTRLFADPPVKPPLTPAQARAKKKQDYDKYWAEVDRAHKQKLAELQAANQKKLDQIHKWYPYADEWRPR